MQALTHSYPDRVDTSLSGYENRNMHKVTEQKIRESALTIQQFLDLLDEFLEVAKFIAEPKHKKTLVSGVRFLRHEIAPLLDPPVYQSYQIQKLLFEEELTNEELAAKIGKKPLTIKNAINQLKLGGIVMQEREIGSQSIGRGKKARKI